MTTREPEPASSPGHAERFFINVIWSWIGIGTGFFAAFFLTRYIIRQLGEERYGIWMLAFALIDYFSLFDLGLRSAVVNHISRFRASGEAESINEVINTALCYFSVISLVAMGLTAALYGEAYRLFRIAPERRGEFSNLVLLIGVSLSVGIFCGVFQAGLEAFQRFKVYNHIAIAATALRVAGSWVVLSLGHGIVAMGCVVVASQFFAYGLNFFAFRRAFPHLRLARSLVRRSRLKDMAVYGAPSFLANSATLLLNQGPPVLVGHFLPEAFVGYYGLPSRLLQYAVDAITRIGAVTAPNTAEMVARKKLKYVSEFGMYLNRYCLALFLPFSTFVMIYGRDLLTVWLGQKSQPFVAHSAPLLPAFVLSSTLALAAQYNSSSILFGMAKHRGYARILILEAILMTLGIVLVLPRYGLAGVAWVTSLLMIASRGVMTPWAVCHSLQFPFHRYMNSIYARPLLCLVPVAALAYWMKSQWLAGRNWPELFTALGFIAAAYYLLAYRFCLEPEHRRLLWEWAMRRTSGSGLVYEIARRNAQ